MGNYPFRFFCSCEIFHEQNIQRTIRILVYERVYELLYLKKFNEYVVVILKAGLFA